jgi:hypothetical protein
LSARVYRRIHACTTSATLPPRCCSRGVPVKAVLEIHGRADVGITLSVYAHILPDMQDEAAQAMDSFSETEARNDSDV